MIRAHRCFPNNNTIDNPDLIQKITNLLISAFNFQIKKIKNIFSNNKNSWKSSFDTMKKAYEHYVRAIDKTPETVLTVIAITFAVIFLLDLITSFNVVNNFKKTIKKASLEDRTDDVNKYIRDTLASKSLLNRRLLKAFPTGHAIIKRVKQLESKIEDTISIKKED